MDTNEIVRLIQDAVRTSGGSQTFGGSNTALLMATMLISALGPTLTGLGAWLNAKAANSNSNESKVANQETNAEVKKIHTAVNSERTEMMSKVKVADDRILLLEKELSTIREQMRAMTMPPPKAPIGAATDEHMDQNTKAIKDLLEEFRSVMSGKVDSGKASLRTTT